MGSLQPLVPGRPRFEEALRALLVRYGAGDDVRLAAVVREAVDHILEALTETAADGSSLAPLDVVRIRAQKLAAAQLPPALWREPRRLAALRAEIHGLALGWLGPEAAAAARFGGPAS